MVALKSDTPRRVKSTRELMRVAPKTEDQRAQWQTKLPSRQRYVCGFAFYGDSAQESNVVLIRKIKPEWQAGKLNGVGGKIEPGETPEQAMAREFSEEAGVETLSLDWDIFARCIFRSADVIFLRSFDETYVKARTMTAEQIVHRHVINISCVPEGKIIPNLRWLIPLAWHFENTREVITINYEQG